MSFSQRKEIKTSETSRWSKRKIDIACEGA